LLGVIPARIIERIYYSRIQSTLLSIYDFLHKDEELKTVNIFDNILIEINLSKPAERAIPFNAFEPLITKKILGSIKKGDIVFDVGAWIGYYTLLAAKKVGTDGKVVAIEAHEKNIERLIKNVEMNQFSNVTILNMAAGEESYIGTLMEGKDSSTTHQITKDSSQSPKGENLIVADTPIKVKVETLDNVIRNLGITEVNLLILDIEGYEYFALKGLKHCLSNGIIKSLICEIHPRILEQYGSSERDVINILEAQGYDTLVLDNGMKKKSIPYHISAKINC
jgi:FkbM family methyltransferase